MFFRAARCRPLRQAGRLPLLFSQALRFNNAAVSAFSQDGGALKSPLVAFMKRNFIYSVALAAFCCGQTFAANLVQYVNPFIGTAVGSGNTYPGAQVPFGMISWSPQSVDFGWSPSGYNYKKDKINGFGLMHLSG